MPRTLNATLLSALDAQNFAKPVIRAYLDIDGEAVAHTAQVIKYELGRTYLNATIYTTADLIGLDVNAIAIERGLNINGTEYVVKSSQHIIREITLSLGLYTIRAELISEVAYTTPGDNTYENIITSWLTNLHAHGMTPVFQDTGAAWLNYNFLPAGKILNLNNASQMLGMLAQKYLIFASDYSYDNVLLFSADDSLSRTTDFTVPVTDKDVKSGRVIIKRFRWLDELGTYHVSNADDRIPVHNLGYLETTAVHPFSPTTLAYHYFPNVKVTLPFHLKYLNGDNVYFSSTVFSFNAVLEVKEILDPGADIGWRLELSPLNFLSNTEAGPLPSTIERVSNYTPLNTSAFDTILSSSDNNLQAAMDTLDDHNHSNIPTTEDIQDTIGLMVSSNTETGISVTYDDTNGKLNFDAQTAGDARYAPIAKGVTNGDTHNHSGGDGGAITTALMMSTHGNAATVPASTTHYVPPSTPITPSTTLNSVLVTLAGTIRNFYIRTGTAQPASGSLVFTVLKNGVATALTITVAASGAAGTYSDTTHSFSVVAGDLISFQITNNATAASATIGAMVVEFDVSNI